MLGVYAHRSLVRTSLKQTRDKSMQLRMSERVCDARVFQYRSLCGSVVLLYKHRKAHKLTHTHTDARTLDTAHRIIACTHTSSTSVLAVALCFTGFFYDFIASQLLVFHALCSWLVARNKTIYRFWLFIYLFGYLSLLLSFFWLVFWVLNFPAEIPEKPNKYTDTHSRYIYARGFGIGHSQMCIIITKRISIARHQFA